MVGHLFGKQETRVRFPLSAPRLYSSKVEYLFCNQVMPVRVGLEAPNLRSPGDAGILQTANILRDNAILDVAMVLSDAVD